MTSIITSERTTTDVVQPQTLARLDRSHFTHMATEFGTLSWTPVLDRTEDWIRTWLPFWNTAVEQGRVSINDFVRIVRPMIDEIVATYDPFRQWVPDLIAWRLHKLLGFLVGSMERHFQSNSEEAGTTWKVVPGAEEFVHDIAASLGLPGVLNHTGYWLLDPDLTFTGESGERLFKRVVQVWDSRAKDSGDVVRPMCRGNVPVDSADGVAAFATGADNAEEICREYEALRRKGSDGRRGLEPETFNRFRNYLCGYGVRGRNATGPNAANLRSNFSQDLLFGLANDEYLSRIFERLEFLTPMDRSIVMGDSILPSVVDRFLVQLDSNKSDVLQIETSTLAERIAAQSDDFRRALKEYKRFYQAVCKLSAMHWQSIVVILIRPFEGLTPEELKKLPVKPTESVGHAGHDRPESIFKMRKDNPVIHKLLEAFDLATKSNGFRFDQ